MMKFISLQKNLLANLQKKNKMDDLQKYIEKRKSQNKDFAENFEQNGHCLS